MYRPASLGNVLERIDQSRWIACLVLLRFAAYTNMSSIGANKSPGVVCPVLLKYADGVMMIPIDDGQARWIECSLL